MRIAFEEPLRGELHIADDAAGPAPVVLVAHGFKGFMGWGMFPWIADRLAEAGFAAVRFDFSHNGADEQGEFTRLDLFRRNTFTQEQRDLDALAAAVRAGARPFGRRCRPDRLALLGHSRGGGGAILFAARDGGVQAVATLAAIAQTDRFPAALRDQALREGFIEIENARTGQRMPIDALCFEDAARHDIVGAAKSLTCPLLVVHGEADESVPAVEGRRLADAAQTTCVEIAGAGHTFGAVHPFAGPTPELERALDEVCRFLARHWA